MFRMQFGGLGGMMVWVLVMSVGRSARDAICLEVVFLTSTGPPANHCFRRRQQSAAFGLTSREISKRKDSARENRTTNQNPVPKHSKPTSR